MVSNKTAHKRLLLFLCLTLLCALLATAVCTAAEAAPANPADGTEAETDKIKAAEIHNEVFGSDHCPVELDIDL